MKAFVFLSVFFSAVIAQASFAEGEIHIPHCVAQGPVYLAVNPDTVDGYIGQDEVHLRHSKNEIFGQIKGEPANLVLYKDLAVRGHIGSQGADWSLSVTKGALYGFQECGPEILFH